jgi:hypothetical protein
MRGIWSPHLTRSTVSGVPGIVCTKQSLRPVVQASTRLDTCHLDQRIRHGQTPGLVFLELNQGLMM